MLARSSLEIKVFGGGNVTDSQNAIGTENSEFIMRYLEAEGLRCIAQDLGGNCRGASITTPRPERLSADYWERGILRCRARRNRICQPPVIANDGWRNPTVQRLTA